MNLSEYGKENNLSDDELVLYAKDKLGMDEEDIRFMLSIERDEVESDVIVIQ